MDILKYHDLIYCMKGKIHRSQNNFFQILKSLFEKKISHGLQEIITIAKRNLLEICNGSLLYPWILHIFLDLQNLDKIH